MNIKNEKGIALIMSIGIVAMLAIIGTTFAINMRLEQKAAFNYLASSKAKALAEADIDQAIAILKLYAVTQPYSDVYDSGWYVGERDGGTIRTASSTGVITDLSKTWDINTLQNYRLKIIDRANWIYTIASNTANTITCTSANFTGISPGEGYAVMVDTTLIGEAKVIDCARQIYVNNADVSEDTYDWNASSPLRTMLNNLGTVLGTADTTIGDTIVAGWGGATLPGYMTKEQIKTIIGTYDYNIIKDYITVQGYVDTNMSPKRAPVNVNTASNAVLQAMLRSFLTDATETNNLANDIIDRRLTTGPFKTWKEFEDYIATLPVSISGPATTSGTEAYNIIYNANPNKTKPATYTTEFCFHSGGNYEIVSTGMVYDPAGNKVAEKKTKAVANVFNVWNQTLRNQFTANILYGLQATTDNLVTAVTVYDTDFESYANGALVSSQSATNGWTDLYGAPVVRNVVPHWGTMQLSFDPGQTAYIDLTANNSSQTRLLTISAWLRSSDQTVRTANLYMTDASGNIGPDIVLDSAGKVKYWNGADYTGSTPYSANTWYPVKLVADLLGQGYWIYFNDMGTPIGDNVTFKNSITNISRIVLGNVSTAQWCYADDFVVRGAGPIHNNVTGQFLSPGTGTVKRWGTVSWTESPPTSGKGVKLELSSDTNPGWLDWKGPSYSDKSLPSTLTFLTEDFYDLASGQGISAGHALDRLKYAASIYTIDATLAASALYDVTITYLPVARILYWRGLGEGE